MHLVSDFVLILQGIIERDQIVFEEARKRGITVFMLTSGGYQVLKNHLSVYMYQYLIKKINK